MEDTQFRIGRYHESHFSNTWAIACAVGLVPKTNHCQHVIISTSIVITSVSAEYLWPTTLKEPCVSYGLCLFAYLESFGYVGLQRLVYTSQFSFIFCRLSQVHKTNRAQMPTSQLTSALIPLSSLHHHKRKKGSRWVIICNLRKQKQHICCN